MSRLEAALRQLSGDLTDVGARYALVGGLAVSVRAEPRTTRDIDVVVAVETDDEAEAIVSALRRRGYGVGEFLEENTTGRLSTVRLTWASEGQFGIVVDLLFFSSGLERSIVERAETLELLPGTSLPVAVRSDLMAIKVLAGRLQDLADVEALLAEASDEERGRATEALEQIDALGLSRGADLEARWRKLLKER